MGCLSSSIKQQDAVGAPRPADDDDDDPAIREAKENRKKERELQLSMCVEAGSVPQGVHETIALECRTASKLSTESNNGSDGNRSTPLASSCNTHSSTSAKSQFEFANPDQTIIILDWDDTICPSTHLREHARRDNGGRFTLKMDQKTRHELNMLADQAVPLMQNMLTMGKVIIVTNAKRPWVTISCNNFLPQLREFLDRIPVIYALELVKEGRAKEAGGRRLLTETKAVAMRAAVTDFYSRYPRQSWKNILSVGDALFEHDAIRQVVAERPKKEGCRTKTIKTIENPTVAGMIVQLSLVNNWMHTIVQTDGDLDIDLSADEETVNNWVRFFGSQHA